MIPTSYEGLNDDEEIKMVSVVSQNNNYYYVVSDSNSNDEVEEHFFDKEINNEVKASHKPLSMQRWYKQ